MINISVIQQPSPHIGFWGRPTGRSILTLGRQVGHASPQWWLRCDQAPARFGGNGHGCLKLEQKPYPFKGYECKGGAPRGGLATTAKIARQRGSSVTDDGIKLDRTPSHRQRRNVVRGPEHCGRGRVRIHFTLCREEATERRWAWAQPPQGGSGQDGGGDGRPCRDWSGWSVVVCRRR